MVKVPHSASPDRLEQGGGFFCDLEPQGLAPHQTFQFGDAGLDFLVSVVVLKDPGGGLEELLLPTIQDRVFQVMLAAECRHRLGTA